MQRPRKINRSNLLGILAAAALLLVLCTIQPTRLANESPKRPVSEPSLLEEFWNAGQGKFWRAPLSWFFGESERQRLSSLISWRADALQWSSSEISDLSGYILEKTEQHNTSPLLLVSLIDVESGFRPSAISHKGAVGLMQVLPATAEEIAKDQDLEWAGPSTLHDPKANIEIGLLYLDVLKREFASMDHVLTAYNIGPRALRRKLQAGEGVSFGYYERVMKRMREYDRRSRDNAGIWSGTWL